jgi:hypothetical protein
MSWVAAMSGGIDLLPSLPPVQREVWFVVHYPGHKSTTYFRSEAQAEELATRLTNKYGVRVVVTNIRELPPPWES